MENTERKKQIPRSARNDKPIGILPGMMFLLLSFSGCLMLYLWHFND